MNDSILIEVRGGVAYVINKPKGVKIIIRDYDNEDKTSSYSEEVFEKDDII